jgi:hypothetical protein
MSPLSVLLVPVREAEAAVAPFRRRLDPTQRQGMPAHVTVLVPFVPPELISDKVLMELSGLFEQFSAFDFVLSEVKWFDDRVVYVSPEPSEPFRKMTLAVVASFPDNPPYEGAFDHIIPHLTVAESGRWRKRRWRMRRAAASVERLLPVHARAVEIWLMVLRDHDGRWDHIHTFPLA